MRRALILLCLLALPVAGLRLLSACLYFTPITVERDAQSGGAGECARCIDQPGNCIGIIEQCKKADPRCDPAYTCILRENCFDLINLDDKINCGLPCAQDAGILSSSDPVISTYLVGLIACAQEKCADPCHFSEAGVGL